MTIESWKSLAAYDERATGRSLSDEAMRKWHARDPELQRIVTFVGGRPGAPRYLFDRWIQLQLLPSAKQKSARRIGDLVKKWAQDWLPLW